MTIPLPERKKKHSVAKLLSQAGHVSRRQAEDLYRQGRLFLNGKRLQEPVISLGPTDTLSIDKRPVSLAVPDPTLLALHKPKGVLTTRHDPQGRTTVYDILSLDFSSLMPVGRLDFNSEGLLLFTNNGDLKRTLELPQTGLARQYRVRVHGTPKAADLQRLLDGVMIEGQHYKAQKAHLDRQQGRNAWLTLTLTTGKNREIRKLCQALDLPVTRLIRTAYGPWQLGKLGVGEVTPLPLGRLGSDLAQALGPEVAKQITQP